MKKNYLGILSVLLYFTTTAQVTINPGDNIPTIVNNNPAGTTFKIKAGLYRLQAISPKRDDYCHTATVNEPQQSVIHYKLSGPAAPFDFLPVRQAG